MKFSTVITKYINAKYTILALLFFGLLYIIPIDFQYRNYAFYVLVCFSLFFAILGYRLNIITITGEIRIEDGFINILDIDNKIINKLSLEVVDEIILKYSAFKGELPVNGSVKNFIPSQGADNKIIIKSQNNVYKYNLYLENQPDAIRFKMLYRFLIENDIKTKLKGL